MRVLDAVVSASMLLALLLGTGCGHYRLGTGVDTDFKTLYVAPVENSAALPQGVALISTQIRDDFLPDARLRLVNSAAEADATLSIRLTTYQRDVATVLPNDTGLARKFELSLSATATLTDNRAHRPLFANRPLAVRRQAYTDDPRAPNQFGQQRHSEYQALPLLAASLAESAVSAVLDRW